MCLAQATIKLQLNKFTAMGKRFARHNNMWCSHQHRSDSVRFLFRSFGQTPSTKHFFHHSSREWERVNDAEIRVRVHSNCFTVHTYTHESHCVSKRIAANADDLLKNPKSYICVCIDLIWSMYLHNFLWTQKKQQQSRRIRSSRSHSDAKNQINIQWIQRSAAMCIRSICCLVWLGLAWLGSDWV